MKKLPKNLQTLAGLKTLSENPQTPADAKTVLKEKEDKFGEAVADVLKQKKK